MDFEQVNDHVNKNMLPPPVIGSAAPTNVQLCTYFQAAAPVLILIVSIPFFPATWKTTVNNLITLLSAVCAMPLVPIGVSHKPDVIESANLISDPNNTRVSCQW